MRSYFLSDEKFRNFKISFEKHLQESTGTVLSDNGGRYLLNTVIQQEIASFRNSRDSIHNIQKAILIDSKGSEVSKDILEESSGIMQTGAPAWEIMVMRKSPSEKVSGIFSTVPVKSILKAALKAGLIKIDNRRSVLWGIVAFILSFVVSIFITKVTGHSFPLVASAIIAAITGCSVLIFFNEKNLPAQENIELLELVLKEKRCEQSYETFISYLADDMTHQMPLVIIVEDLSKLDTVSADVISYFTKSDFVRNAGALLWIVFQSRQPENGDAIFQGCSFVKRLAISEDCA